MGLGLVIPLKWVFIIGTIATGVIIIAIDRILPGSAVALGEFIRGLLPF